MEEQEEYIFGREGRIPPQRPSDFLGCGSEVRVTGVHRMLWLNLVEGEEHSANSEALLHTP